MDIKILPNKNFIYKVDFNETLKDIANKFKISESKLILDNKLQTKELEKGDLLFIASENKVVYAVKPLDNLQSIAKRFNVSVDYIKLKNNLNSNYVFIGQILTL